jgi:urea transporter
MQAYKFIKSLLRGVGQVMFQNNALSGALMLAGIFCNSVTMGIFALCGTIVSTVTAKLSGYDPDDIDNGLYGFNGTLVGIGIPCFLAIDMRSVILMIAASALSSWVAHAFGRQKLLPGLTAPFVVITWGILLLAASVPALHPAAAAAVTAENTLLPMKAFSLGFGQIMLQGSSIITGWLFLLGIAVNSRGMALRAAAACLTALAFGLIPLADTNAVNNGLFGYNAILAFIAVTDIVVMSGAKYAKAIAALLFSFVYQYAGLKAGVTTLTAPFVLAVWTVVLLDKVLPKPAAAQS